MFQIQNGACNEVQNGRQNTIFGFKMSKSDFKNNIEIAICQLKMALIVEIETSTSNYVVNMFQIQNGACYMRSKMAVKYNFWLKNELHVTLKHYRNCYNV